jgi:hypothetical protein
MFSYSQDERECMQFKFDSYYQSFKLIMKGLRTTGPCVQGMYYITVFVLFSVMLNLCKAEKEGMETNQ